ncbi:DNA-binding response regulator [Atopobacter sp. AH10]|uniref:response regulator transcription factor n=1 Tax=Atopobacter sp. AH10 TaxID=2315861 RepID=UPI000EF28F6F|nr:response regulator transcription factor [Atopobacter sp. AH10]RLK63759.1 DNA-binding response regulator [Atopobacter sp. AH10]
MNFEEVLLAKNILIVDDDLALNRSIKEVLLNNKFVNIISAYSIEEAISIYSKINIEFVILDIMLPDGEGFEFAKYIRREKQELPILFLTARDNPTDEIIGFDIGGDDYVTKPFIPKNLVYRILSLLRRSYRDELEVISIGDCLLNLRAATIEKNNECITLTSIELQILKKLIANKNYIVSIDSLCNTIWGEQYFGYEKSLIVHIRNIREKIEDNPSKPKHLLTARGLGYKFIL